MKSLMDHTIPEVYSYGTVETSPEVLLFAALGN